MCIKQLNLMTSIAVEHVVESPISKANEFKKTSVASVREVLVDGFVLKAGSEIAEGSTELVLQQDESEEKTARKKKSVRFKDEVGGTLNEVIYVRSYKEYNKIYTENTNNCCCTVF
eukprot:TRINITY_DN5983_c0_g1_i13.p1 TRINITY_DN5983_c0_g1~~TRINITY_DN5983_c0_g1_i13.p1  ORF type:complete len:116 (-),score=6.96 TRINITY_DN5983_c0_g1_i13:189-536(-)